MEPACHGRAAGVTEWFRPVAPQDYGRLWEADQTPDVRRGHAVVAQLAQARRPGRLGKLLTGIIQLQTMMPVVRFRHTEQILQQPVHAGRPEQVRTPHHIGDALQGVIDHDRYMIAGWSFLARQDDIAPRLRPCRYATALAGG